MARIKLQVPEKKLASITIPVRITDINYGNHVGNDSLVAILHEARVQWLNSLAYTELDVQGAGLIMSELAVEYISESFYGDVLKISVAAGEISRVGFELYYLLETSRGGEHITVAKAKTGMVCYDYTLKKVVAVPEKMKDLLV